MLKLPADIPKTKVIKTFEQFGFYIIREREHISMERENSNGTRTPLTMPNHHQIKGSALRTICTQAGIKRDEFLKVFEQI